MPPKKKRPARAGTKPPRSNGRSVRIRMYNVGFGDAFLVFIPDGNRERKVLFDCGSIDAAAGITMKSVVDRIVQDATDSDSVARIDVVVATHRHKDHVSGFGQSAWDRVHVREVWMPWTEHPTDADARRIRDVQSRLALGLQATLAMRKTLGVAEKRYQDMVANALMLSNDKAMKTLHGGFVGNPRRRFLPGKTTREGKRTFETDVLPGVKIHILGPSRDPAVIRDMDPPKGESYLRMGRATANGSSDIPAPFSSEFMQDSYTGAGSLPTDDLVRIQRAATISDLAVAVALDKAVNGTSLMLALEVSGTFFLFPGDAQWGTWDAAMKDPEWKDILERVAFYKVGHHGSHNATPKDFVEEMIPDGICAMTSTLTRKIWPDIPKAGILDGLAKKKALVARSDQEKKAGKPFQADKGVIETSIPL